MDNFLVSIILPIYNVEKYLNRCLKSITQQTYKNIEIILVDDCSTDSSPKICDTWALNDTRVVAIHKKENEGLGKARNTGLSVAKGDFVFFIDSDDFVSLSLVEECLNANKGECDIIQYGHFDFKNNKITNKFIPLKKTYSNNEVIDFLFGILHPTIENYLNSSAWSKMYSTAFLKKANFFFASEREYISEDIYSHLLLIPQAKKITTIPKALYYYCFNDASLTNALKSDRLQKNNYQLKKEIQLIKDKPYEQQIKNKIYLAYYSNILGALKNVSSSTLSTNKKRLEIKKILTDQLFLEVNKKIDIREESLNIKILNFLVRHKMIVMATAIIRLKYRKKN